MSPVSVATDVNVCVPIMQAKEPVLSMDSFPMNVVNKHILFRRQLIVKPFEASFLSSLVHVIITFTKQLEAAEV